MQEPDQITMMRRAWQGLYGNQSDGLLDDFIGEASRFRKEKRPDALPLSWYKDAIVYSLYVDLFNRDFRGLGDKLPYLAGLGVNCLWLLPVLDSPMRDAGFDISDYQRIRPELLGLPEGAGRDEQDRVFREFLEKAHQYNLRVIFDIAINHASDRHPWFAEARKSKDNPYHDYFIWSKDDKGYRDARIIFYGIEESNWKKDGDEYYFHRFFDFQPDLNYRNPKVLIEMARNFLFWLGQGVDGFRADAIPYLWKEEGTACENLPGTHRVVQFLRAVIDFVRPGTLLLAEACQKPHEVVKYFGQGDECNAGYHFPLMPQIFKAVAQQNAMPVKHNLSPEVTPEIPENTQWFTFLRCHDELSLELVYVTEEDRKFIHDTYCRRPEWDFRLGQGISARLAELMDRNPDRIGLIFSIMLTLPGTPVIYYGDEFAKLNDLDYYHEMIARTGKDDTRFLVRGKIDWEQTRKELDDPGSLTHKVFEQLTAMVRARKEVKAFGRGTMEWIDADPPGGQLMAFSRSYGSSRVLVVHNLGDQACDARLPDFRGNSAIDLLGKKIELKDGQIHLPPLAYHWILL